MVRNLHIETVAIEDLNANPQNPRAHSDKQVAQLATSIETFGVITPPLVDGANLIIAGHGRVAAATRLGLREIQVIRIDHMTEAEKRAFAIADNKLGLNSSWDLELLAKEFQALLALDLEFELPVTGFEMAEIDLTIAGTSPEDDDEAVEVGSLDDGPTVTLPGDVWLIGKHRLICGDATDPETFVRLLDGECAQMVFTDPPYNVAVDGHVCGSGSVKHREFAMASGEMSQAAFAGFLTTVFANLTAHSNGGTLHYICMDWRHMSEVLQAGQATYTELKNLCVWAKTNGGMGSLYRSQHELVFVFKSGKEPHINNIELGRHGRYRTNLWTYAGINSFGKSRDEDLAMHPTVKPVALVADAILDGSKRKGIVLDAFAGSGTTLLAAHRTGRRGYAIEIDPAYCDVVVRRLVKSTKLTAVHGASGRTFEDIESERLGATAGSES